MSWSIAAKGTPDELQSEVHHHEAEHWKHLPLNERLLVHHACGHAIEHARECGVADQWVLQGSGSESDTSMQILLTVHKL